MMKWLIACVGVMLMALGFEAIEASAWFGWVDISLGILAILSSPSAGPATRYLVPLGPVGVGAGALLVCLAGVFLGIPTTFLWATLSAGLFLLVVSAAPMLGGRSG